MPVDTLRPPTSDFRPGFVPLRKSRVDRAEEGEFDLTNIVPSSERPNTKNMEFVMSNDHLPLSVKAARLAQNSGGTIFDKTPGQHQTKPLYLREDRLGMFTDPIIDPNRMQIEPLPPTIGEIITRVARNAAKTVYDRVSHTNKGFIDKIMTINHKNPGKHVAR